MSSKVCGYRVKPLARARQAGDEVSSIIPEDLRLCTVQARHASHMQAVYEASEL